MTLLLPAAVFLPTFDEQVGFIQPESVMSVEAGILVNGVAKKKKKPFEPN